MSPRPRVVVHALSALVAACAALAGPVRAQAPSTEAAFAEIDQAEDARTLSDGVLLGDLQADDAAVRARAALAVGRLQDTSTVAALVPLLDDSDPAVRRQAVFALGQIGSPRARVPLEQLLDDNDEATTDLVIEALGKIGDKASTPAIVQRLDSASPLLRGEAAVALWRLADPTALDALLSHHDDPDPEVRWRVLYALEKIDAPDRIVLVAALHLGDDDPLVRAHAVRTLGRQRSPRASAYLQQMFADPSAAVVVNAIRALGQVADTACGTCAPSLTGALSHPSPYVRLTAATVLAQRFALSAADSAGRRAALDSLRARLHDPDAATRGAAARALWAQLGPGARIAHWKDFPDVYSQTWPVLHDASPYARAGALGGFEAIPDTLLDDDPALCANVLGEALGPSNPLIVRLTAAGALGTIGGRTRLAAFRAWLPVVRAGLADSSSLFAAACAGALADFGDSASAGRLAAAWAARGATAEPDERNALRDALDRLAGKAFADSVERVHPAAARPSHPAPVLTGPTPKGAVIHTERGDITWDFNPEQAPHTVANFVQLAESGYFDGSRFHRVVPDFVIQDGDPTGTGWGGPGYTIRCEYNLLRYDAGMVGMALSGKDTGGSQWFITQSPQPHLNGRYTIFAHVTAGMNVVKRIVQGDRILGVDILP